MPSLLRPQTPRPAASRPAIQGRGLRWAALCAAAAVAILARVPGPLAQAQTPAAAPPYQLIVNPSNPAQTVDRSFVSEAFLKKVRRWPSGEAISPVDLVQSSPVRSRWTSDMLNRSVEAVRSYWQQKIFSGRELPPPELESENDVVSYVLRMPGGIGYVSGRANLRGARPVAVK